MRKEVETTILLRFRQLARMEERRKLQGLGSKWRMHIEISCANWDLDDRSRTILLVVRVYGLMKQKP